MDIVRYQLLDGCETVEECLNAPSDEDDDSDESSGLFYSNDLD